MSENLMEIIEYWSLMVLTCDLQAQGSRRADSFNH